MISVHRFFLSARPSSMAPIPDRFLWTSAPGFQALGCSAHLKVGPGSNLAAEDHPDGPGERWHGRGHSQGQEYSGTRAFVGLAPALASHTHTHSDTPFCVRLHGGGLGASEDPLRDLSAARRGGARSGGHLSGIRKDPISSSNGATSICVWCAPPGRGERGPTPLHPGGPPLGVQPLRHLRRVDSRCAA